MIMMFTPWNSASRVAYLCFRGYKSKHITTMRPTIPSPSWLLSTVALLCLVLPTNALYFYMDATTPRCFMEELPKDTLVVGQSCQLQLPSSPILTPFRSLRSPTIRSNLPILRPRPLDPNRHHSRRDLRLRPPRRLPARRRKRALHLHRRRLRRPPHLLCAERRTHWRLAEWGCPEW